MKVSLLSTLLLECCITLINSTEQKEGKANVDLYVLTVLPYIIPGLLFKPSHSMGPALYIAIELAADMLNNRTDILDGYQLKLLQENGGCDIPFRSIDGLVRGLSLGREDPPIVGMLGPACSISSTTAAAFNGRKEVSLLNIYSGGAPEINDRMKYPFSFGILDSIDVIADTLVALIKNNSWKKISVFHEESRLYFSSLSRAFNRELSEYNEELHEEGHAEVDSETRDVLLFSADTVRSVQNMNRIVIFMVGADLLKEMVCVLHHIGLRFPNYLFILAGLEAFNPSRVIMPLQNITCTADIIETILATSVLIDYQLESLDEKEIKFSNLSLEHFREIYSQRIQKANSAMNASIQLSREGAMYFDSLWSLALALNNSIDHVDLTKYRFLDQQESTKIIRSELLKLDYEGLSGRVKFNNVTGRVEQNVSITLIKKNLIKIAYYNKITNEIIILNHYNYTNIFISDQFMVKVKTIPKFLSYVIMTFAAIAFFVMAVFHTLIVVYRERKPVKATSIKLNWLAFTSCYLFVLVMVLNIFIHGFSDKVTPMVICTLQHVFDISLSVGLTLMFGTACLHRWRLYKLLVQYTNPGKFLSAIFLVGALCTLVIVDLILVVPSVFISRYEPDFKDITSKENTEAVLTRIMVCNRKDFLVWFFCGMIESIFLMITLLVFTVKTRKILHKHFTAKWTACQLYLLTIILPFFLGLYLTFYSNLTYASIIAQFVIHSFLMLSLLIVSNLILVLPLVQVFQESRIYLKHFSAKQKPSRYSFYGEDTYCHQDTYHVRPSIKQTPNMRKTSVILKF